MHVYWLDLELCDKITLLCTWKCQKEHKNSHLFIRYPAVIQTGYLQSTSPTSNFYVNMIITESKTIDIREVILNCRFYFL
jgi:hypothetical protein